MSGYSYWVNISAVIIRDDQYLMIFRGDADESTLAPLEVPGGKVENAGITNDILEKTLYREVQEEVGIEVHEDVQYLSSMSFIAYDQPALGIIFLCHYKSGVAHIADPSEVAAIQWMTAEEVLNHPMAPEWTQHIIRLAQARLMR